jgi:hypothetical protein
MAALRIAHDVDDREVLADFCSLHPDYLAERIAVAGASLDALREAHEHVGRLLLLYEVIDWGQTTIPVADAGPLMDFLWEQAQEAHKTAGAYEVVPAESPEGRERMHEYAAQGRREAEVCARLIEQLSGGEE